MIGYFQLSARRAALGFVVLACLLAQGAMAEGPNSSKPKRPNVVFIFVDDQGYYDLSCYGATEVKTPRVDALAKEGVRFTDYYAAAPICSPSRAGLVSGCYPRRTGNEIWVHRPDAETGIPPACLTMAELFNVAGYSTACIGKWHLGFKEEYLPWKQGFDHYFGVLHNLDSYETKKFMDYGGNPLMKDGEVFNSEYNPTDLVRLYTEDAIRWMKEQVAADKPFYIYMPHTMLHVPLETEPQFKGSSNWGEYGDAIQEVDYYTGQLLDALKQLGIEDNTIVVYTSDNGRGPGRNESQPLRGAKLTTYEGGLRVPAIVAGPGIRKGFESHVLAHSMDWYPTLASLAGIRIPEGVILDGRDLSALLAGKTDEIPAFDKTVSLNAEVPLRRAFDVDREWSDWFTQEEYLNAFFYHGSQGALAAVRFDKWKLVLNPDMALYDLEKDPGEHSPLPAPWPAEGAELPTDPEAVALHNNWKSMMKLRGMVIQFQREMNKWETQ